MFTNTNFTCFEAADNANMCAIMENFSSTPNKKYQISGDKKKHLSEETRKTGFTPMKYIS